MMLLDFRLTAYQNFRARSDLDIVLINMAAQVKKINEEMTKAVVKAL